MLVNRSYLSYTTYTTYSTPLIGGAESTRWTNHRFSENEHLGIPVSTGEPPPAAIAIFFQLMTRFVGRRESRLPLTQVFLCQPPSNSRFWLLIFGESDHRLQGLRNL